MTTKTDDSIQIDENCSRTINCSSIFNNADFVKLDTKPECLMSNIAKILVDRDRICCFDPWSETLFIFNRKGHFVFNISKSGRGPGELISCRDFLIDRLNKQIEILDASGRRVFVYDYDGKLLKTIPAVNSPGFEKLSNDQYVAYSYNIAINNNEGPVDSDIALFMPGGKISKVYKRTRNVPSGSSLLTFTNLFKTLDGSIYLLPVYDYSLLRIDKSGTLLKVASLSFKRNLPSNFFKTTDKSSINQELRNGKYPYLFSNLLVDCKYVYFKYEIGKEINQVFWNQRNHNTISISKGKWNNDLTLLDVRWFSGVFENGMIQVVESTDLIETYQDKIKSKTPPQTTNSDIINSMEKLASSLKPEDNPVLVFYSYK
jgi:hypothetical protein